MSRKQILDLLIKAIKKIQKLNGKQAAQITESTEPTEPLFELDGFDSMNAFEVSSILSEKLDTEISVEVFGLSKNKKHPLKITMNDIAENIMEKIKE